MRLIQVALLAASFSSARAVVVNVFSDAACTVPIGNSSTYTAFAGICNTAFTPDNNFSVGLDFCSPQRVVLSLFPIPAEGAAEVWGSAVACDTRANATVALVENACTPVRLCADCAAQFFRLVDTRCDAPVATYILQHDRGELGGAGVQGCQPPLAANAGQRFQTREVLLGVCNARTVTRTPDSTPNGGNCANALSTCARLDIDALSVLPVQTAEGLDVTTYFADSCDTNQLPVTWQSVPVQDKNSLFCRIQSEWNQGVLASYVRHGLRVYAPPPYATQTSESPSPSPSPSAPATPTATPPAPAPSDLSSASPTATPSLSLGASPSATPPPSASPTATPSASPASAAPARPAAAAGAAADAVSRAEFAGVSAAVLVSLAALGAGLAALYLKLRAAQRQSPAQEPRKEAAAVEMVNVIHSVNNRR